MAAVTDQDEPYDGPYADDLDHLTNELNEPPTSNAGIYRPRTLDEALTLARTQNLNPFLGANGNWIGFDCPTCLKYGQKHAATLGPDEHSGILVAVCHGCNDDHPPGILGLLGQVHTNGNGVPDNVVHLHPERANGTHPDPAQLAWVPLDLVKLGDRPRVPPAIGGLIYPGRKHIFWGESESGKSWLTISCAADELKAGYGVVWVDIDYMGAQDILERLRQLSVPDDVITERFAFYQPEGALEGYSLDAVIALMAGTNARLVIIDAFTGFCALHGLNPEKTIEIEKAYHLMNPLCTAGAGVVVLDHVVKNADNRGTYAIGAERKKSGADVAIGFTLVEHYGRGKTGKARLIVHKDRPAMLQRPVVGVFTLRSHPDTHQVNWSIEQDASKADDGTFRPTGYMERVSRYLEKFTSPMSRADVLEHVTGKDAHLRTAMDALITEGFLMAVEGPRNSQMLTVLTAFREDEE